MSLSDSTSSSHKPDINAGQGPGPHEDLTIAEEVATMRCEEGDRPQQICLLIDDETREWIDQEKLDHFLNEHGALHSSDYESIHGNAWIDDLLKA